MSTPVVIALLAAVIGPLLTYIAASRKLSGRIGTSEAASLWQESQSIRQDYRDRINESERRQAHLEERVAKLEEKNNELMKENLVLRRENLDQAQTIRRCQERIEALERENTHLKSTIQALGGFTDEQGQ